MDIQPPHKSTSAAPVISVLIAVGGTERLPLLGVTLAALRAQQGPPFELIVVEQGVEPHFKPRLAPDVRYNFLRTESPEQPFNKAWALNVAARMARGEFLAVHDADYIVPRAYLQRCAEALRHFDGVRPCRFICYLDRATSERICESFSLNRAFTVEKVVANNPTPVVLRRDAYWRIGGHDESFQGWGGEDDEFLARLRTLSMCEGGFLPLIHLWHSSAPKKASGDRNRELFERLMAVPEQERIKQLLAFQTAATTRHTPFMRNRSDCGNWTDASSC